MADVTIAEMLRRFQALDTTSIAGDAMESNADEIVQLNREQLEEGYDADGDAIKPDYSAFTRMKKLEKNQRFDVVTLKDTGAFHESIQLNVKAGSFELISKDSKSQDLKEKYGYKILGLSPSGKKEAWVIIKPEFVSIIKQRTGAI